jgi:hypothetical protein
MIPDIAALLKLFVGGENMPSVCYIEAADKGWSRTRTKGMFSLAITLLLCLPSLVGGTAFLMNLWLYRDAAEWGQTSGALVALGCILGRPLTALAAVVGSTVVFRGSVSPKIKYAHMLVVGLATVSSLFFVFRFGM